MLRSSLFLPPFCPVWYSSWYTHHFLPCHFINHLFVYRMADNGPLTKRTKLPFYRFINHHQFTDILPLTKSNLSICIKCDSRDRWTSVSQSIGYSILDKSHARSISKCRLVFIEIQLVRKLLEKRETIRSKDATKSSMIIAISRRKSELNLWLKRMCVSNANFA